MSTPPTDPEMEPADREPGELLFSEYTFLGAVFALLSDPDDPDAWLQSDTVIPVKE